MLRLVSNSFPAKAGILRRKCLNIGAESVIVLSGSETMVEFPKPNDGMTNKKRKKYYRDVEARLLAVLQETDGWVSNKNPAKMALKDWEIAPCGFGVKNPIFSNHVNRCKVCDEVLSNKPVNQAAARVTGGFAEPPAQRETTRKATAANDFNMTQPVTTQKLVATITKDRGEDFVRLAPATEVKKSILQAVDTLETTLLGYISKLESTAEQLATGVDALRKWAETITDAENELAEIEAEFAELESRKAELLNRLS